MPIVSAVLVLRPEGLRVVGKMLAQDTRVTVGDATRNRLPIVLETASRRDDRNFWDALGKHPLVAHHHILFADVSDITQPLQAEVST